VFGVKRTVLFHSHLADTTGAAGGAIVNQKALGVTEVLIDLGACFGRNRDMHDSPC
jgi:hypothetical protein